MDRINPSETERVFIPSSWRMISMHTGVIVACSLLGLILCISADILHSLPTDIMSAVILLAIMDISALLFFTVLYGFKRELFSIKMDAVSVTGPCRFFARNILRSKIDPARSMRRNLIDRFMRHWHIRDAQGNGISISGLDFRPDEIAEILKTVGLEPT